MHLKSITMKGFKSFPQRARLEFSPGVSVIVGPNGSGKSNITDAVLWALGEQSPGAVRGASMQDVICAGGKGVGLRRSAEVEVVIDNSDGRAASEFSEIAVQRSLDRSGEGGYRLNGARCRLVDVVEVLSDANMGREMHSVISQGRVESIVHSKPRERRLLVEEAAGLSKHRKRRRRAELKLRAARDNLDRALDVEREARAHLRPLKRQAQAAELGARIEREELGLRGRLVCEDLRFGADRAAAAEEAAERARARRAGIEERLAEVSERRRGAEERFTVRDRERTHAWGLLTKLRSEQERVTVRAASLAGRQAELATALEALRAELGPLTLDLGSGAAPAERARKLGEELAEIDTGLAGAVEALALARSADAAESAREGALGAVRAGAERAARHARRAEGLLGERHREALRLAVAAGEELAEEVRAAAAAMAETGAAIRARVERTEGTVVGSEGEGDEIAEEMRACSQREFELRAELKETADELTKAEVQAAHLGDRRAEAARELAAIAERLGEALGPAPEPLTEEERAEIDRRLERLERRRAQIGPVNPLAEREYEEAREHVEGLEAQREDTERAMRELETLIRDVDGEIERAFEETFAATAQNFEEMVEHLFPGGRGRLRRVSLHPVRDAEAPGPGPEGEGEEEEREELGVEIEVTPAGKSTRKLSLLSGGEKSLVALAFVFAVFLARPCPFYILDEVEAALDDANIDRFLQLVRRFSDRAQFIVVTHQKRTMDAADVLYGVSMGGDGVTKVVSRRLPREVAAAEEGSAEGPPPFAGISVELEEGSEDLGMDDAAAAEGSAAPGSVAAACRTVPTSWQEIFDLGARQPEQATPIEEAGEERSGVFRRLREGLSKSRQALSEEISASFFDRIDDQTWERLEEALIYADAGAPMTAEVVERLEREVEAGEVAADGAAVRERLIEILAEVAGAGERRPINLGADPAVLLMVGVNGTGKTTTIGKIAWHLSREFGLSVLLAAGDTYRAAAAEQLAEWAERAGADLVRADPGADPGAVAFDAISAARARGADVVIVDTAGRLHTQGNLMEELMKVRRVIAKQIPEAPHETLISIDATTGQNGLRQAKVFSQAVEVDGVVLTKLDGTAKGGIVLAIASELGIPVKLIGTGESLEDLRPFDSADFARALLAE